jgi:hypothetical protein
MTTVEIVLLALLLVGVVVEKAGRIVAKTDVNGYGTVLVG